MAEYESTYKRNRSRKPLELDDAKIRMTDAVKRLEQIIMTSDDENRVINAANALSGIISRYAKLIDTHDHEKRLQKLEEKFQLKKVN